MKPKIKYFWGKDHLQIDLGNQIEPRIKILYCIEFAVTIGIATIVLLQSFNIEGSWIHFVISTFMGLLYLLAAYRFLSRMFYKETLLVTNNHFIIVNRRPFDRHHISYDWQGMGPLHYIGKDAKTDHPLKGNCFDYFGFDTQERLVQNLHHDGNLYFDYHSIPVRFARGIYSWHAEEIVRMIKLFSGTSLQLGAEWEYLMEEMEWDD